MKKTLSSIRSMQSLSISHFVIQWKPKVLDEIFLHYFHDMACILSCN